MVILALVLPLHHPLSTLLSLSLCRVQFRMQEEIELKFTKYHKKGARYVRFLRRRPASQLAEGFRSQLLELACFRHPFQCSCCCQCQTVKVSNYTSGGNSVNLAFGKRHFGCCHTVVLLSCGTFTLLSDILVAGRFFHISVKNF